MTPDVLTVGEVAAFMLVSRDAVCRMAERGGLPGRRIRRHLEESEDVAVQRQNGTTTVER